MEGEINEGDTLTEGAVMGLRRNLVLGKPRNSKGGLQLRPLVIVEWMHEWAFLCIQIDDYPNCHHRAFFQ